MVENWDADCFESIIFCALSVKGDAAVLKILHEVSSCLREYVPHL